MQPSLPVPLSSLSYWHRTTRGFPHLHANSEALVPSYAKYVIIGSGISGALTAFELLRNGIRGEDIAILEAREAVSGATGRNAGHVRPDPFRGFFGYVTKHGHVQARKIIENEKIVLENVRKFVEQHKVDCDFRYTTTLDLCFSQDFADYLAKSMAAYKAIGGDVSHITFHDAKAATEKSKIPGVVCAYEWPAGSNHPAKLTQWILANIIDRGVGMWTHCPATKVVSLEERKSAAAIRGRGRWDVHTPRGTITTEAVIHCTNAHAAYLIPELTQIITPLQSQAHAFIPPFAMSGENALVPTLSLRYGLHHFFSVNQIRGSGAVILGGSSTRTDEDLDPEASASMRSFSDTTYYRGIASNSTREFLQLATSLSSPFSPSISSSKQGELRQGEGLEQAWTGTLGMTPDNVPLIGPIEGKDGQWICAGFNGHGMARIFTCAPGLVQLILGESWESTGLPECFEYSQKRVDGLSGKPMAHI